MIGIRKVIALEFDAICSSDVYVRNSFFSCAGCLRSCFSVILFQKSQRLTTSSGFVVHSDNFYFMFVGEMMILMLLLLLLLRIYGNRYFVRVCRCGTL